MTSSDRPPLTRDEKVATSFGASPSATGASRSSTSASWRHTPPWACPAGRPRPRAPTARCFESSELPDRCRHRVIPVLWPGGRTHPASGVSSTRWPHRSRRAGDGTRPSPCSPSVSGLGCVRGEMVAVTGSAVACGHVAAGDRVVPVRQPFVELVSELAGSVVPDGFVFHPEPGIRNYHNFLNGFLVDLERPRSCPTLTVRRLRASYVADLFVESVPVSQILRLTGIAEVESLLRYTRVLPGLPATKAGLRALMAAEVPTT